MDTQWTQSAQKDHYIPANNSDTVLIHELSKQSTETTQTDLCLEDFIGSDEIASHWNLLHTGPFTQPQYGGDLSRSYGLWGMDPTFDNFHPAENITENYVCGSADTSHENSFYAGNMAQHHAPNKSIPSLCAIVDSQQSQIRLSLPEIFELPLPPYTASTYLRPGATSPQQPADIKISQVISSRTSQEPLKIKLFLQRTDGEIDFQNPLLSREFKDATLPEFFAIFSNRSGLDAGLLQSLTFVVVFAQNVLLEVNRSDDERRWENLKRRISHLFKEVGAERPQETEFEVRVVEDNDLAGLTLYHETLIAHTLL